MLGPVAMIEIGGTAESVRLPGHSLHGPGEIIDPAVKVVDGIRAVHTYDAREHCPHRLFTLSQTGVPGVITVTNKWCRVCGKDLGPARLKKSLFGNQWV